MSCLEAHAGFFKLLMKGISAAMQKNVTHESDILQCRRRRLPRRRPLKKWNRAYYKLGFWTIVVDKMFSFTLVKFPDFNADLLESSKVFSSVDEFES